MKIRTKMWSRLFATFAALLLGASAVQAQSDPISVLNSEEFYNGTALDVVTNSVEVVSDPNGKLVVTIGAETGANVVSVTYGGVALSAAIDNNSEANRLAAVYYLDDPVAGTADLVVTYSADVRSRIGAVTLGNAADGVSVTADAVAATTDSLSVDLTTIAVDTLVIGAFSQNDQGNGTTVQPYPSDQRISHGDSGSSFSSSGYVQVPVASGPTTYTWTIASPESCDAVLAGFASAGEIITDPISVLNSDEYYGSTLATTHTLSFETISDPNGKLVVTIGSETGATIDSVTYGGVALTEAANTGTSRLVAVYYLDDPVAGTDDIVVTFTGGTAKTRIGAVSLGNAADGVSVTADAVAATTDSLSVDLTTIKKDTLVIAAYTQNGGGLTTEPYSAGERISYGDSGSSLTSTGYVQVPTISGPTTYTWTLASAEPCDAVLVGFASAGEIVTDPISVLNSEEFYSGSSLTAHTHSFEVISDPNGKLVVTVGAEGDTDIASVTYGGLPLTAAIYNNNDGFRIAGVYYLDDPVAGTDDLVVTFTSAVRTRIGAVSLGNAADGVSVTAGVTAVDTDSLSVDLTTIAKDTLVVGVYSNNNGSSDDTEPYPTDQRISHGNSGSSNTYSGYVQVPEPSGPTAYTWTISAAQVGDAVLAGFASAGEIVTNPIVVTNSAEAYSENAAGNVHTLSGFAVSGQAGRKLVVCTATENAGTVVSITYGGTPLTLAAANSFARLAEVWYLDDPVVGAADIVVTMSAVGEDKDMRIAALSLAGAQPGVSVSTNLGVANVTTLTVPLETTAKDTLVVGTFTNNGQAITSPFANTFTYGTSGSSNMNAGYINVEDPTSADYVWTNAGANHSGAALAGFAALVDYQEPEPETYATFDAPVVAVTPTIDGIKTLGEWGDAFELPMQWPTLGQLPNVGSISLGGLPESEAAVDDISAVFYFKWDATHLYILAEVTDDALIKPTAGGDGHPDDHFILGIDPDLTDGDDDVNIFLAEFFIDSNDAAAHYYRSDLVPGIVDPALNVFTNHSVTGSIVSGGYVIELALNWADLGVASPVATDMIGVSILLFDNDVDDAARDVSLNSTGGSIVTPSEFHQVTLTGLQNTFANFISQYDVGELTAGTDDPDLDEVDNFTEYALGGDPTVNDAASLKAVGELAIQGEDDVFAFTYNRRIGATALGLTYAVKGKTDLNATTWSTTGITDEVEVTTLNDEFEAVTATTPMDTDKKFLHLEITD